MLPDYSNNAPTQMLVFLNYLGSFLGDQPPERRRAYLHFREKYSIPTETGTIVHSKDNYKIISHVVSEISKKQGISTETELCIHFNPEKTHFYSRLSRQNSLFCFI